MGTYTIHANKDTNPIKLDKAMIGVNGCRNARQSGGKGIAQNYGFARHGGLERSPKGEFQDPHGVAAQFLGCGVVICV